MRDFNLIFVDGRLGADAEVKFTKSGKAVCEFRIAHTTRKKNGRGEWVDDNTTWRRVSYFGRDAEALAGQLAKGMLVSVAGRETLQQWERQDGSKGFSLDVVAESVQRRFVLSSGAAAGGGGWNDPAPLGGQAAAFDGDSQPPF